MIFRSERATHAERLARKHVYVRWLAIGLLGCGTNSPSSDGPGALPGGQSASSGGSGVGATDSGGSVGVSSSSGAARVVTSSSNGGEGGTKPGTSGAGGSTHGGGGSNPSGGSNPAGGNDPSGGSAGTNVDAGKGGVAGTPDGGGNAGATSYPMLAADQIGAPVRVSGGYGLAENPLWDPCSHELLFVDVQGDGGKGIIYSLGADGQTSVFMRDTGNTNGMAFDIDGSLILAQMGGTGHIGRRDASGTVTHIDPPGAMLHTPDDVTVRSDGTIYFTDGDFCPVGNLLGFGSVLPVYTIPPGTSTLVNSGTVGGPNGIELSPDERTLYVDAYGEGAVWTFAVAPDGSLKKATRPLVTGLSHPDSLCLDAAGNLYVAVSTGLQVLRPDGTKVKLIPITSLGSGCLVPGVTNCTFGGDDGRTLYLTNWTTLYKVEGMPIPGLDWVVNTKRVKCN